MRYFIAQKKILTDLLTCESGYENFLNFLKNDFFGYYFICDFSTAEEYNDAIKENPLLEIFMDKFIDIKFNPDIENDIFTDEFYNGIGEQNIFLINKSKDECDFLSKNRGYIYLSLSNINEKWELFSKLIEGIHLKVTRSNLIPEENKLDSWNKISNYLTHSTSLIIFDKYILKDSTNQKMQDNLFPLIDIISSQNKYKKPTNITIITELNENKDEIIRKYNLIDSYLKSKHIYHLKINIIKHNKAFYARNFEGLHSRFILSNYFHLKCDDSFNFFKSNQNINNDADPRISFSLSKRHSCFFDKELNDVRNYIERLENNEQNPSNDLKIMYHEDKRNYLIKSN